MGLEIPFETGAEFPGDPLPKFSIRDLNDAGWVRGNRDSIYPVYGGGFCLPIGKEFRLIEGRLVYAIETTDYRVSPVVVRWEIRDSFDSIDDMKRLYGRVKIPVPEGGNVWD